MYRPEAFAEDRPAVLAALIRAHPLGLLVTAGPAGPQANPLPFDLSADGTVLRAHLARGNPQLAELRAGSPALVVFQGDQAYVSPGWYPSKQAGGKVVPTWNYLMVQARGPVALVEEPAWLHTHVGRLTAAMEAAQVQPWAVEDAPADYLAAMLRGIVGIELTITALAGKWKASQNRAAADRQGVAAALAASHPALAAAAFSQEPA